MIAKPHFEVVTGILVSGNRVLVTQRLKNAHMGGLWEFPGGKREAGESEHEALKRELREELGVEVEVGACLHRESYTYPQRVVDLAFFLCALPPDAEPCPLQASQMKWVVGDQLDPADFPPANRVVLEKIARMK